MASQQSADMGAGVERPSPESSLPGQIGGQMASGQTTQVPKGPRVVAAFGSGGGAAIVFSDLASI